ncbi:hypothetical protein [Rhodanobacter denitrificans]|uniref:hypothetical protein n=1 Tax=Rhodanobacter denitrificans TaxID=666685 RepID=UPI001F370B31|nr:hypothetical protein [Rhodanobacter denitrificans]UJJ60641.1 hypothetical protein LRK55_19595 [Rhodanobacter denitrificans]
MANYRADRALVAAVEAIHPGGDPWEAFSALQQSEQRALEATGAKSPRARDRVTDLERRWLRAALGQGNLVAAAALFPDPSRADAPIFAPARFAKLREESVDRVLTAAHAALRRQAQPTYTDRWMLHAAANIHAAGTDRPRNPAQARQLYAAAFAAGDTLAALGAARMAKEAGLAAEAYRWALRCTGPCRTPGFDLSTYQAGLTKDAIAKAQEDTRS